jgi:predicted permease
VIDMSIFGEWARRLWYLLNRRRFEEALRLEMEAHRERLDNPERFGNTLRLREQSRDVWGWAWLEAALRDLRLAARTIGRAPGFSLTVIATLALGFVLTISTFAVVNAYLIRALPYPGASRLYHVIYAPQGRPEPGGMRALDWKELNDVVELVDSSLETRFFVYDGAARREVPGMSVSLGSMELLGVRAIMGRSLEPADFQTQAEQVALVTAAWWQAHFGSDSPIIGSVFRASRRTLAEPDETFRVVGILPPEFRYARETGRGPISIVVPLRTPAQSYFVRLRAGVPIAFAEKRLTETARKIATSIPDRWPGVRLESARDRYIARVRPMLTAMAMASAIVLLTVCANIAVLMLLRSLRRRKEVAVRVSLGAGSGHIFRMLAAEAVLLIGAALATGLTLAKVTLSLLAPQIEARLGLLAPGGSKAIGLDATVLAVAGGVSVLVAILLSFIPLLAPWQGRLAESLRRGGRGGTRGESSRWVRFSLVALETGASLALLVGSALMVRTVMNLVGADLGYETANIVRARVALPARTYPDAQTFLPFYDRLVSSLSGKSTPFALANFIALYDAPIQTMEVEPGVGEAQRAGLLAVSDGYFAVFGIKVVQGRAFTAADGAGSEPVAIVSETLARRAWPNGSAIGRRIRTADQPVPNSPLTVWRTVVGVTRDIRQTHTDQDLKDIFIPFFQAPSRFAQVYLKTHQPVPELKSLESLSASIDAQVQISTGLNGGISLDDEVARLLAAPRFLMSLLTGFAGFAVFLALLGIYGVSAFAAQQREQEVAIRIAIGASRSDVVRMFLRESMRVLAAGIAIGALGSMAVANLLRKQIFGVEPFDVSTLTAATVLMVIAGSAATWWPAKRAASKNPLRALSEL